MPHTDDPSYHVLSIGTTPSPTADDDGMDAVRDTITVTPGDVADASPLVCPASSTSVSIHGGWLTFGSAIPAARVTYALSSVDRLSSVRSAADAAMCVAGGSSRSVINVDVTAMADRSRATEDTSPMPAAGSPHMDGVIASGGV